MRLLIMLLAGLLSVYVNAASCPASVKDSKELIIETVGNAYFGDLSFDTESDTAELFNGVCIESLVGWVLLAERVVITQLQSNPRFNANDITMQLPDWTFTATSLRSQEEQLEFEHVVFEGAELRGDSGSALFDLGSGDVVLRVVRMQGKNFQISGESAALSGDVVKFEKAVATTCVCDGPALYEVVAENASYNYKQEAIVIANGVLQIGKARFQLGDTRLSPETLSQITSPLAVEYITDSDDDAGTGLGVSFQGLPLAQDLKLDVGVVGLDTEYPLGGVLLLRYRDDNANFTLGKAEKGLQADFRVTERVATGLNGAFYVRNQHWNEMDYLHEAGLELIGTRGFSWLPEDRGQVRGRVFAAVSEQTFTSDGVTQASNCSTAFALSPRLGAVFYPTYRTPDSAYGSVTINTNLQATYYPSCDALQYGVTFAPVWNNAFHDVTTQLSFLGRLTNSASPFSTSLDKLEPKLEFATRVAGGVALGGGVDATFLVASRFDVLDANGNDRAGFESLNVSADVKADVEGFTVRPFLSSDLSSLANGYIGNDESSFVELGVDVTQGNWLVGASGSYEVYPDTVFDKVETRFSFPVHLRRVELQPFLAFDWMPTINAGDLPRVSGHGLAVSVRSCCGTITGSYRQVENRFTTSFSVSFSDR